MGEAITRMNKMNLKIKKFKNILLKNLFFQKEKQNNKR